MAFIAILVGVAALIAADLPLILRIIIGIPAVLPVIWLLWKLRAAYHALNAAQERNSLMLQGLPEGCRVIDDDWRYVYVNEIAANHEHSSVPDMIGRTLLEIHPGIENSEFFRHLQECMKSRSPHMMENLFHFEDGSSTWLDLSVLPVPGGILVLSIDITERKNSEEELRLSEQRFRTLVDNAIVGIYRTNLQGNIIYVNQAAATMFGYNSVEAMMSDGVSARYKNVNDRVVFNKELTTVGRAGGFEVELITRTGETKNVIMNSILESDTISGMLIDISGRKLAEANLVESAKQWQSTFNSMTEWVSIHDKNYRIIRANKAMLDGLGMKPEDVIGSSCHHLIHGISEPIHDCPFQATQKTRLPSSSSFFEPHLNKDMEVSTTPILDDSGNIEAYIHIVRDITEQKKCRTSRPWPTGWRWSDNSLQALSTKSVIRSPVSLT